jgi:hypothetical protein
MTAFIRNRSASLSMVVLMLAFILFLQTSISYSVSYGPLDNLIPGLKHGVLPTAWIALRVILLVIAMILWLVRRKQALFRAIIATNSIFTFGLFMNMIALLDVITRFSSGRVESLITDIVLMAVSNILIFSIWYWIIDPPGVEERERADEPWDLLFPQRGNDLPKYEDWEPKYTDYLFVAFTTSFAFSPTDTLPLTRRAKMLMLLQSTISLITITGIAGGAINLLAGSS